MHVVAQNIWHVVCKLCLACACISANSQERLPRLARLFLQHAQGSRPDRCRSQSSSSSADSQFMIAYHRARLIVGTGSSEEGNKQEVLHARFGGHDRWFFEDQPAVPREGGACMYHPWSCRCQRTPPLFKGRGNQDANFKSRAHIRLLLSWLNHSNSYSLPATRNVAVAGLL